MPRPIFTDREMARYDRTHMRISRPAPVDLDYLWRCECGQEQRTELRQRPTCACGLQMTLERAPQMPRHV